MAEAQTSVKPWQSKTVWINAILGVIAAVAAFFPAASVVSKFITDNASFIGMGWSVLNLILRAVTKEKISLGE